MQVSQVCGVGVSPGQFHKEFHKELCFFSYILSFAAFTSIMHRQQRWDSMATTDVGAGMLFGAQHRARGIGQEGCA